MRGSWQLLGTLAVLVAVGCGDDGSSARDDAPISHDAQIDDAPPDAPANPSVLTMTPTLHDFGTVAISQSGTIVFTVTNTGTGPTGEVTVETSGAHAADFTATTCPALAPTETCSITVAFVPATQGARVATLQVSAAGGGSASALLQGTAVAPTSLTISPETQALGSVVQGGQSSAFSFTISNVGFQASGPLSFTLVTADASQFEIQPAATGDCVMGTTQLAGGASCTVRVKFKPTTLGLKNTTLQVGATPGNTVTAALSGEGVEPGAAALSVNPTSIGFGTVTVGQSSTPTVVTVTNTGGMPSSTVSVVSESARFSIVQNNCTTVAAMGGDCTFQVIYNPTVAGVDSGTVRVQATQGGNLPILVSGTGSATLLVAATGPDATSRVTSNPAGIDCAASTSGAVCSHAFTQSPVQLTAVVGTGTTFGGWGGACSGMALTCTVTMDAAKSVTATFTPNQTLSVSPTPSGGTITSAPGAINCGTGGATCSADYPSGSVVTLTATPAASYRFGAWSGACAGTSGPSCTVTMNAAKTVSATFVLQHTLTIVAKDLGVGTASLVTATGGNTCASTPGLGTTCTYAYDAGDLVTLGKTLGANAAFVRWVSSPADPSCTGTVCQPFALTQDRTVTAEFAAYSVVVTLVGSGTVAVSPGGLTCSASPCTYIFPGGTSVSLTPQPAGGSLFWGWTGGGTCTGTGSCSMNNLMASTNVTAEFRTARSLTVSKTGSGTVTSSPAGIACGSDCTEAYPDGTMVTLTAAPDAGWEIAAWTGACAGAMGATCTVTMDAAKSAGATFEPGPDLEVTAVACTPDPVAPGTMLSCDVTVQNTGTQVAAATTTRLVLSTDLTIDGGDPQLATCAFASIAAGDSLTVTCAGTVPAATANGTFYVGATADSTSVVVEKTEANNTATELVMVSKADISVSAVACTPNPAQLGAAATCAMTFANAGGAFTTMFTYAVRFSYDATITTADAPLGTCTLAGGIGAGASVSATCDLTLLAPIGENYVGVIADTGGAIAESDETNNTGSTPIAIATDLAISGLSCTDSAAPGETVTCTYMVSNEAAEVGTFTNQLRLSTDSTIDTSDALIATCSVAGISEGGMTTVSCSGPAPAATGVAHVGIIVDALDVVVEWNASNNTAGEQILVRDAGGIDLVGTSLSCTPSGLAPGGTLSCMVGMANVGVTAAGPFTVRIETTGGTSYLTCSATGLAAGATSELPCSGAIPMTTTGSKTIRARLDNASAVTETNETNNNTPTTALLVAGSTPDLVVSSLSCPTAATPGGTITCDVTIKNNSTTATGLFENRIVRATATPPTSSMSPNAACDVPGGVPALGAVTLSCALTLTGVNAGAATIGFVVDSGSHVAESSESNNTATTAINVTTSVDLSIPTLSCAPKSVVQGDAVACSGTVRNSGPAAVASTTTRISSSSGTLATCATPAIPALGTASFDCVFALPMATAPGSLTLTATADSTSAVSESSEANNTKTDTIQVISSTTDLVAQSTTCSSDGVTGTCSVTVYNSGAVAASAFAIGIRQSPDATVNTNDPEVGTCSSTGLAGAATATYTCTWPVTSINGYAGAFVDSAGSITESSELNNVATTQLKHPDLSLSSVSCSTSTTGVRTCRLSVTNLGTAASASAAYRICSSTTSTFSAGCTPVAMGTVDSIAAGSNTIVTATVTGTVPAYYTARVDDGLALLELSEANNTGAFENLPDLYFSTSMTCSFTSCTLRIGNDGTKSTGSTTVVIKQPTSTDCATGTIIGSAGVSGLSAGATSGTITVTISGATSGWACAKIDDGGAITETSESNNDTQDFIN